MTEHQEPDLAVDMLAAAQARIAELEMALDVLSLTDGRTGLASRNALIDATERELHRVRRYGGSFGVLVGTLTPADDGAHIGAITAAGLRNLDIVATWGEWTIGILFEGLATDEHELVWKRIQHLLPVESAAFAFPDSPADVAADELLIAAERAADPLRRSREATQRTAAPAGAAESGARSAGVQIIVLDAMES